MSLIDGLCSGYRRSIDDRLQGHKLVNGIIRIECYWPGDQLSFVSDLTTIQWYGSIQGIFGDIPETHILVTVVQDKRKNDEEKDQCNPNIEGNIYKCDCSFFLL